VADAPFDLPPPSAIPFVGREKERIALARAIADAKGGRGETWLVEGPAGIGKTRLVRWLEEEAVKSGFRVLWGYCLKESNLPFFPFQQIFRRSSSSTAAPAMVAPDEGSVVLPLLTLFEDERPSRLLERVAAISATNPSLVVTRELASHLRKQLPALAPGARILQLTKGGEGKDCLSPGHLDAIGERLSQHLKSTQGAVLALASLDYLVSQNGFPPVLRLVQFLREEAERVDAHVMLSVNPAALEKREMALLEGEGEVLRETNTPAATASSGPEPPAMMMMRYLETLERESPSQPRLLVIDDVQWADPDSLRTLQFLSRNIRNLPVLLVGTMRVEEWRAPEEKTEQGLEEILGRMDAEGSLLRLPLRGLGEEESQSLAEDTIGLPLRKGDETGESALLSIFQRAEGNPYFVQETMRQLVQEGLLRREGDHAVLTHPSPKAGASTGEVSLIPPTLRRLVARRLSMLTREEMGLLRWAAVAGSEFDLAPLASSLQRPAVEVSALLRRLERELHILDTQPGGERWSFAHPLVWEVTLAETATEERRRKALILADWWAEHRASDVETAARLYRDALEPGRGLPWVRKAVDMAMFQHAPETVERYHRWMQDLLQAAGTDAGSRVREGMTVCEQYVLEIGSGQSLNHMLEFLASLPATPAERLPARILLAYSRGGMDSPDVRAQMDDLLGEISREHGRLSMKWEVVGGVANADLLIRQGRFKTAIEELQRLSQLAQGVPEPWVKGRVIHRLGFSYASVGPVVKAKESLEQLRSLILVSGQSAMEASCHGLEAAIADAEGNLRQSEESEGLANAIFRRKGNVRSTAVSLGNMVMDAALRGKIDTARTYLSEAQSICNRFGFKDLGDFLFLGECYILWGERRWDETVRKLVETFSRPSGVVTGRMFAHALLAEGYVELKNVPSARLNIAEAEKGKEEFSPPEFANVLRVRARVEEAEGDPLSSRKTLAEALRVLEDSPHLYWGAWVNAELARWESMHGDPALASSFRAEAESLFDKSGVLPAGRPIWLRETYSNDSQS
jgi:hypothetical protein